MRVVHVVLSLDCGGLERMVLGLIRAGRELNQEVNIVCIERLGTLAPEAQAAGAKVFCVEKKPGLRFGTTKRLRKIFQEISPDVVHTHQIGALLYAGSAARKAGVPVIVHTEHGNHLTRILSWFQRFKTRFLYRHATRRASRFCCVSSDIAKAVTAIGIAPEKVIVVANGIDAKISIHPEEIEQIRRKLDLPSNSRVIGTVGRLSEIKRQDLLLQAFQILHARQPDIYLLLVGDGNERTKLESLASSLGIIDRVRFAGYQSSPESFLRLMNVFALTSRSEGMPVALLEAWAAGLPVVASRVGGIPELVRDRENGLLFDFPDVQSLASALETVLTDLGLAKVLGESGHRVVSERFDLKFTAQEYQKIYHLVGDRG